MNSSREEKDIEFAKTTPETQMNTTFADQKEVKDESGQQTNLPSAPHAMPDAKWFAAQQLEKPIIVSRLLWNISAAAGDTLLTLDLPDMYSTMSDNLHTQTLKMYSYYRGNPVLRFQLNGTKFHLGQLIAVWMPLRTNIYSSANVLSATGYPHVQLSASGNDPVELMIPYVHPQTYLTTTSANTCPLGQLRVRVLNPLRAATSSSTILSLTVTLHWDKPEVHVPIYNHAILTSESPEEDSIEPIGLFDKIYDITQNATATISHLMTGNVKGVLQSGGATLSGIGGLDKPAYVGVPQKTISPLGPLAHGKGVDVSHRLGLDAGAHVEKVLESYGGTAEEMETKHIISTPMMIDRINWSTTNNPGDVLRTFPVAPTLMSSEALVGMTYLGFLAQMFAYWRGSIKFRFDFISTSFHTGRLLVAFLPEGHTFATPTLDQAMSLPYAIVDMQKTSRITLEVPFISNTPFKFCGSSGQEVASITGYLFVYVLNDLVMPSNVASDIDINIYVSAGDDFEFAVPRNIDANVEVDAAEPIAIFEGTQEGLSDEQTTIVLATQVSHDFQSNFGESYTLFDVAKRYGTLGRFNDTSKQFTITPDTAATTSATRRSYVPVSYIMQIFACWSGSLRYKFATNAARTITSLASVIARPNLYTYPDNPQGAIRGYPALVTSLAQDNALEVETCPYTFYNFALSDHPDSLRSQDTMGSIIFTTDVATDYEVFQAAGDDFQAFYMVAPPYLVDVKYLYPTQ